MKLAALTLNIFLLAWMAYQVSKGSERLRKIYWPALVFKLTAGIAVGLVYTYYYKLGDTLIYFSDGSQLASLFEKDAIAYFNFLWDYESNPKMFNSLVFKEPRALLFVKIVSVFCLISFNSYWIITLYFSLLSFLGSWYLVRKINLYFPDVTGSAIVAFLFFPSVVFWSSGVIKESLAMAALFFLSGIFLTLWFSGKIKVFDWVLVMISTWLLWNLKYYFAAVFFSVAINSLFYKFMVRRLIKPKSLFSEIIVWILLFFIPLVIVVQSHPNFYTSKLLEVVIQNYRAFYSISAPEDIIIFKNLQPDLMSILANAPWALFSGLFRPFLWESNTLFQVAVSIENLLLLAGFAAGAYSVRKISASAYRMLFFSCVVYIAWLCIFITLSTPNFGTLSRYRVSYMPYFAFLLLCSPWISTILQSSFNRLVRNPA